MLVYLAALGTLDEHCWLPGESAPKCKSVCGQKGLSQPGMAYVNALRLPKTDWVQHYDGTKDNKTSVKPISMQAGSYYPLIVMACNCNLQSERYFAFSGPGFKNFVRDGKGFFFQSASPAPSKRVATLKSSMNNKRPRMMKAVGV